MTRTLGLIIILIGISFIVYLSAKTYGKKREDFTYKGPTTPIKRLTSYFQQDRKFQIFIGVPLGQPKEWIKIVALVDTQLISDTGDKFPVEDVTSFIAAYPTGQIMDYHRGFSPLPDGIYSIEESKENFEDVLTLKDIEVGKKYIEITFDKSPSHPDDSKYYSTTLRNVSKEKLKILMFGGYREKRGKFHLSTITKGHFSENEFREWYELKEEWLMPGHSVCDPNNYGGPRILWAYYCQSEKGYKFIAGNIGP